MSRPSAQVPKTARPRTALAQHGGAVRRTGDPELAELLADAMLGARVDPERWTHGFHVYPARMHPEIAARLCRAFVRPGTTVLDPFCGSGTVLLEAMAAGGRATGVDLNPLALRLAALKCTRLDAPARARLLDTAAGVAERTLAGVRARLDVRAPLSPAERAHWDAHVLRELAVLHREIGALGDPSARETLLLVLSSIVVKFSRQRADTSTAVAERRIGKGVPTRFFARKAEELVRRLAELDAALPAGAITPRLLLADARQLTGAVTPRSADLVITSPPYVGTYDYVEHHARRWAWLGLDPGPLVRGEIGSRRDATAADGAARWDRDLSRVLRALARVLVPGGTALLLIGDGEIAGRRIPADVQLRELGERAGLASIAVASQARADWRGGPPREEHLVAMRPSSAPARRRSPPRAPRDSR